MPTSTCTSSGAMLWSRSARRRPTCRPAASSCSHSGVFEVPGYSAARAAGARPLQARRAAAGRRSSCSAWIGLRDVADAPFEPSTMRGTISAQVTLGMPLKARSAAGLDQLRDHARCHEFCRRPDDHGAQGGSRRCCGRAPTPQGFQLKGDVKIAGAPASLEYRKTRGEAEAEIRLQGTLDEAARANLGFDPATRSARRRSDPARRPARHHIRPRGRFDVEADLTPAQIDGLLPGWAKPSGKPARATFTLVDQAAINAHRGPADRGRRRRRQRHDRFRWLGRTAIGQFPGLRLRPTATARASRSNAFPTARCG